MRALDPPTLRGITVGLWTLTGLTFLADALLPGIGRVAVLAPWLLAVSVAWTAMIPMRGSAITNDSTSGKKRFSRSQLSRVLLLLGFALALAVSFTIIRDGDRRSFVLVGFVSVIVLLLAAEKRPAPGR